LYIIIHNLQPFNKDIMHTHRINKLNTLLSITFVAFFVVYGCSTRSVKSTLSSNTAIDSLEKEVLDSAYTNVAYSRQLLNEHLARTTDSIDYYRLMTIYGKMLFMSADYDSASHYFRQVKHFIEANSQNTSLIKNDLLTDIYNTEGNILLGLGDPDSAAVLYEKAYHYCRQSNRTNFLPDLCINLADAYSQVNRYDLTSHYYRRALSLCDSLHLPESRKIPIYYGLGHTYMSLHNFTLCDFYYNMADSLLPQMSMGERFIYFNNRGNSYYYRKDYSTALQYIRRAYQTVQPYPHLKYQQQLAKGNLGELFLLSGKPDSARTYIDDSYRYFSSTGNQAITYYMRMLQMSLALKTNRLDEARHIIEQTARDKQMSVIYANARSQYLQQYYQQTGNYREAYRLLQENTDNNDSVRNERLLLRISEMGMRYRQDTTLLHRDIRIKEQEAEIESGRLHLFSLITGCLLLAVGLLFTLYMARKRRELLTRRYHEQFVRARVENLRSNVSPHFIFNVLGHELQQFADQKEVKERLLRLIHYLRHSLRSTDCLVVSLKEELLFVEEYIHWSTSPFADTFHATIEVDEAIDTEKFQVLSMIIQIPVENAIKHGLYGLTGEKRLIIRVKQEMDGIRIKVSDNGHGYTPGQQSSNGTGTGLRVINQTIFLLNRRNKNRQITFDIQSSASGTHVSIYIPTTYNYAV
jgi:tetratricopeptide (TPR) repeat protein/two-component sensor histidine kinase